MIKKLIEKWKQEWLSKHSSELILTFQKEIDELESNHKHSISIKEQEFSLTQDIWNVKIVSLNQKIKLEEEAIDYKLKSLEERKIELAKVDNELRQQIKLLEAKASPTSVWVEAFTSGVNKTWEMLLPVMTGNVEAMKKKIYEDATMETMKRMTNAKK